MRFKPSIGLTFSLGTIAVIFALLGKWQLERAEEKQILFDQFENAPLSSIENALESDAPFVRVQASGHFDESRHILLDNKVLNGRVGVHALTPFYLVGGKVILVNRGWLPLSPDRRHMPGVPTDRSEHSITGLLRKPPTDGLRIGEADVLVSDRWPQLVTYLDMETVSGALGTALAPWVLQLDPTSPAGFEGRQWKAAVMEPEMHSAYAVQWFALSLAAAIIWLVLGLRRATELSGPRHGNR